MARHKYTIENYEEVLRLHVLGNGYRWISEKTGFPVSTVGHWCSGRRKPFSAWTEEEKAEWKRKKLTPEARAKMSRAHTGMRHSPETIEKMRLAKLGSKNPMWGRKRSRTSNL